MKTDGHWPCPYAAPTIADYTVEVARIVRIVIESSEGLALDAKGDREALIKTLLDALT